MPVSSRTRTRIKLCGLGHPEEVATAVAVGADAIGLVFYAPSVRAVSISEAATLVAGLSPFITLTGLFVNAPLEEVAATVAQVPLSLLQFHGDESPQQCAEIADAVNRPFIRALRVGPDTQADDLLKWTQDYAAAGKHFSGLLLDTWTAAYGGSGERFDWSIIPPDMASRIILSGGLNPENVSDAVQRVRPFAVDVSSGIEVARGVKDLARMRAFVQAVRQADTALID